MIGADIRLPTLPSGLQTGTSHTAIMTLINFGRNEQPQA
ncbi:MAG: hypothetical protein JWP37_785 [Mucilaginibacter sp.]|nr:hypothetical protein [Mucilaginibacter sp.]